MAAEFEIIRAILAMKRATTSELYVTLKERKVQCPDDLARTLNIMRRKGLIKGEVSQEKGGWVWWVEE